MRSNLNRNAVRSKRLIRNAFKELLREKTFEKITVTDLVARADVNRSTFYAHYPDIFGIIEEIENDVVESTIKPLEELGFDNFLVTPEIYIKEMLNLLEENRELYQLLSKSNIALNHLEKMKNILITKISDIVINQDNSKNSNECKILMRFIIGGMMEVYIQWINGELAGTLNEVTDTMSELVMMLAKEI